MDCDLSGSYELCERLHHNSRVSFLHLNGQRARLNKRKVNTLAFNGTDVITRVSSVVESEDDVQGCHPARFLLRSGPMSYRLLDFRYSFISTSVLFSSLI